MPSRAEIIRAATEKARKDWVNYLGLQNAQIYELFRGYANDLAEQLAWAEKEGKVPIGASARLMDYVRQTIPNLRKSLAGSIRRGISNSVDAAFKAQILSLNAAGIAKRLIQIGTSYLGKDGQVIRWDAAKEAFLDSAWSRMNTQAVSAVMAWKPSGIAFSDRVWDISWQSQKKILSIIEQGVVEGKSAARLSRELRQFLAQPETLRGKALAALEPGPGVYRSAYKNAMRLARTELNRAYHEGTRRYAQQKTWIDGFFWRVGNAAPCQDCLAYKDKFFAKDELPDIPLHPHCLPAGMLVSPCGDTLGATSRDYCGEMLTIETASHKKLTCTPNHPILTRDGWVAANQLNVGRHVISSGCRDGRFVRLHDIQKPALIEDIVRAFRESRRVLSVPVPVTAEDFHGDGVGSEVAVISTDRLLRDSLYSQMVQVFSQVGLILRDIVRGPFDYPGQQPFGCLRHLLASPSGMGGLNSTPLAVWRPAVGREPLGLVLPAYHNTSPNEGIAYRGPAHVEAICQRFYGFTRGIERDEFRDRESHPSLLLRKLVSFLVGSESAVHPDDPVADCSTTDTKISPDGRRAFTSVIPGNDLADRQNDQRRAMALLQDGCFLDRITHIHSSHYKGQVYNLNTTLSYYYAEGIATHNCLCYPELAIQGEHD